MTKILPRTVRATGVQGSDQWKLLSRIISVSRSSIERGDTERQTIRGRRATAAMRTTHSQRGFGWAVDGEALVLSEGVLASSRLRTARPSTSGVKGFCKKLLVPSSCPAITPTSSIYPDMNRVLKSG